MMFDNISAGQMTEIINKADYLGINDLIEDFCYHKITNLKLENLKEVLDLGIVLYDKCKILYNACIAYIANDVQIHEAILTQLEPKVLFDLSKITYLWFRSEYEKYLFLSKIAKILMEKEKIQKDQLHVFVSHDVIDYPTAISSMLSNINYHQFDSEQFDRVILDDILSYANLQQIIELKQKLKGGASVNSRHYLTFCVKKSELANEKICINSETVRGPYKLEISLQNGSNGDNLGFGIALKGGVTADHKTVYNLRVLNLGKMNYFESTVKVKNISIWAWTNVIKKSELIALCGAKDEIKLNVIFNCMELSPVAA